MKTSHLFFLASLFISSILFSQTTDSTSQNTVMDSLVKISDGIKRINAIELQCTSINPASNGDKYGGTCNYQGNTFTGIAYEFNGGNLVGQISFKNGKKDGLKIRYSGWQIIRSTGYKDGKLNGKDLRYAAPGGKGNVRLIEETDYTNGLQNGDYAKWDVFTGTKLLENKFVNGVPVGPSKQWYPDGKIKTITYYKNGEENESKKYSGDGTIIKWVKKDAQGKWIPVTHQ